MGTQNHAAQVLGALPRYADGGLLGKIKDVFSSKPEETMREKFARKDAEFAAKQAKNQPAPTPTPPTPAPAQTAIGSYAANSPLKEREEKAMKAAGLKKGGAVRGAGTGTSDDIPIMASNGEFMIKASSVKKIGLKTLEALNAIGDKKGSGKGKGAIREMATGIPHMESAGSVDEAQRRAQVLANGTNTGIAEGGWADTENERAQAAGGYVPAKDSEAYNKYASTEDQDGYRPGESVLQRAGRRVSAGLGNLNLDLGAPGQNGMPTNTPPLYQSGVAPVATSPTAIAPAATPAPQAATNPTAPAMAGYDDPRLANKDPSRASLGASRDFSKELNAVPAQLPADLRQGVIHKTMGPNGSTTYSGMNVAPDAQGNTQMVDGMGKTLQSRGTVTMLGAPGSPGGAVRALGSYGGGADTSEALQAARMAAVQRGDIESVRASYGGDFGGKTKDDYATDPILGAIRNLANGPMTAKRAAAMAQLQSKLGATLAGQSQASTSKEASKLARDKFGVDAKSAGIDQEVKSNMLAAQKIMADPKATPEQKAMAEENYRAWQGKYAKEATEQYAYAPGGQSVDPTTGQPITQPGVIFNKATGEIKQQGGQRSIQTDPRATAIKNNAALSREQKITELKKIGYQ